MPFPIPLPNHTPSGFPSPWASMALSALPQPILSAHLIPLLLFFLTSRAVYPHFLEIILTSPPCKPPLIAVGTCPSLSCLKHHSSSWLPSHPSPGPPASSSPQQDVFNPSREQESCHHTALGHLEAAGRTVPVHHDAAVCCRTGCSLLGNAPRCWRFPPRTQGPWQGAAPISSLPSAWSSLALMHCRMSPAPSSSPSFSL